MINLEFWKNVRQLFKRPESEEIQMIRAQAVADAQKDKDLKKHYSANPLFDMDDDEDED